MFSFTPLLGAQSTSTASQSILELDGGVKLLVDVGWDDSFDAEKLQSLESHVSSLSLILLTHPTIDHLGAYAHCCKHIPLFNKIPVYASTPVVNLGRALLTDLYTSSPLKASTISISSIASSPVDPSPDSSPKILLPPPTSDEIATYFNHINPLKYSQPHQPIPSSFSAPLGNLTITAYSAGHTPGGTIWHIQHGLESIVYAADWNQGRENLLSGAAWLGSASGGAEVIEPLRRPTTLVCSAKGVEKSDTIPRKKREEILVGLIRDTIAQGGKVLIPSDSSARVLELAFILNHTWRESLDGPHADTFKHARIYMASSTSTSTVRQLPSMLEWLDEAIIRDAETVMNKEKGDEQVPNLLDWKYIRQIERKSQLDRALARSRPCVILASDTSLEWGFSRQALERLAADARNLLILTENISSDGATQAPVGKQLLDIWREHQDPSAGRDGPKIVRSDGLTVQSQDAQTSPLSPDEELLYQQYLVRQRQLYSSVQGDDMIIDANIADVVDDQASESSESDEEDEDTEQQGRALNLSAQMTQSNKRKIGLSDAELGINVLLRSRSVHDFDVRNKRGRDKVFPFVAHRNRSDEFGDVIKPEEYLRAEERNDTDGADTRNGAGQEAVGVGQKRKWENVAGGSKAKKVQKDSPSKRPRVEREPDDIDALIARATGESRQGAAGANGVSSSEDENESDSDYEPGESDVLGPRSVVLTRRDLPIQLRITYVDFSGLHEKRDLQMLIPLIQPRKLVLIAGDSSETLVLADECRQLLSGDGQTTDIFTPVIGETIDASVDTNAWTLKLSRQLFKKLIWQNVKGLGVVALTGQLDLEPVEETNEPDMEAANKKLKLVQGAEVDGSRSNAEKASFLPVLDLVSQQPSATGVSHQRATQPVHVGDLRLTDLRRLMQASGHTAEFRGEGTLLIDGTVAVRKSTTGRIEVEAGAGGLGQPQYHTKEMTGSFYAVRQLIYGGLAVVSGV